MKLLPWDVETTGFPIWKEPSESENQPHIVQLCALLVDSKTKKESNMMNVIIRPEGWIIPQEVIDIHGITNEQAMDEGIPEQQALEMFLDLYRYSDLRIAHNTTFDNRMIRIGLKRYFPDLVSDEEWKNKDKYYCTWMNFKKLIGGKDGHTLEDAFKHFTGDKLEGAHDALIDTRACLAVYFGLNP